MLPPLSAEDDASASKVLNNDGLLGEILGRLHCTNSLICAALTSKHWFHNASHPATIRNFRSRQSPHLLGIYISGDGFLKPEFVSLSDASRPELAAALRHGNFRFDGMGMFQLSIWDCHNDRVLYGFGKPFDAAFVPAVRKPLKNPSEDTTPQLPATWQRDPHAMLLPDDEDDDSSCYRVDIKNRDKIVFVHVLALRAGSWSRHCVAFANLARPPVEILKMFVLMRGKIYMLTRAGYILALDMASNKFIVIDFPEGVEYEDPANLALCRGDDSVIYLFHVREDKLTVWLKRMNDLGGAGGGAAEWVLRDTISLLETCGHLIEQGLEQGDVWVVGVGDNAEFVFLEFGETGIIVYLNVKSREVKVVYQRHPLDDLALCIHPFMMVWPPVFPKLDAGDSEGLHQEHSPQNPVE